MRTSHVTHAPNWVDFLVSRQFRTRENKKVPGLVSGQSGGQGTGVARARSDAHAGPRPGQVAPAHFESGPGVAARAKRDGMDAASVSLGSPLGAAVRQARLGPDAKQTAAAAKEATGGTAPKFTARVYVRAPAARGDGTMGASASGSTPAAPTESEMPPLTARQAEAVAARMLGAPDRKTDKYLAELAAWQADLADAGLARLIALLDGSADAAPGGSAAAIDPLSAAEHATTAWLLSACLRRDEQPFGTRALDDAIDRRLRALDPQALVALYQHALPVERLLAGGQGRGIPRFYLGMVGLPAARDAWAANRVCQLVGKPLSFDQLRGLLRDASARDPNAVGDTTALAEVAADLDSLVRARYQPVLMQRLRAHARAVLDEKGISVNALAQVARQNLPDKVYAGLVADALARTLAGSPAPGGATAGDAHPTDVEVRRRLDAALDEFSHEELHGAASNLLMGDGATAEHARHLRRLVGLRGAGPAGQASLERQFTILCEAIADRVSDASRMPVVQALHAWDWDTRLTRHDAPVSRPGRLRRLGASLFRGLHRAIVSVFDADKAAAYRARDARADLEQAAGEFLKAVGRNAARDETEALRQAERHLRMATRYRQAGKSPKAVPDAALRAFNDSEARLLKAAGRYEAACRALGPDACKAMGLATQSVRFHEDAFRAALARMPGEAVDALGRACFGREWKDDLLERQQIYRTLAQTEAPRTRVAMRRMLDRYTSGGKQHAGLAQTQALLHRVDAVLREEPAIRAAAEVVRTLGRQVGTQADPAASDAAAIDPSAGDLVAGNAASDAAGPAAPAGGARAESDVLDDIWTLEQRFRPRERQHGFTMDWSREYFVRAGMARLPADERERLRQAVCDLDRSPPAWLQRDPLWLAVVRYYQARS